MTERLWIELAVYGGFDPWGDVILRDLIIAAEAKNNIDFRNDKRLVRMISNMFSDKPKSLEEYRNG